MDIWKVVLSSALVASSVAVIGNAIVDFFRRRHEKELKRLDIMKDVKLSNVEKLWNKLIDLKLYLRAKCFENSGCEFEAPIDSLPETINKSALIHITELRELKERAAIFIDKPANERLDSFISDFAGIVPSVELTGYGSQKENSTFYKGQLEQLEVTIGCLQKDLSLS